MKDELDSRGATAVVIGSGTALSHRLATRWLRLPWPVLRDPDRSVYREYGLIRRFVLIQQSGTFIVDGKGILRYAHGGLSPYDAFHTDEVTATLRQLQR
jgi:peroxiredoxin